VDERTPGQGSIIGNVRSKISHAPDDPSYSQVHLRNQIHFVSREAAHEAGYRPAVNQHYAPGRLHPRATDATRGHRQAPTVVRESVAQHPWEREEESRDLTRRWERPLIGNNHSRIYHTSEHKNYGDVHPKNQVHFWTEQAAQDAGYRRAKNDHYGRGTGQAMNVKTGQQQQGIEGTKRGRPGPGHSQGFLALLTHAKSLIEQDATGGSLHIQLSRDKEQRHGIGW
jgi:hypothetical protein